MKTLLLLATLALASPAIAQDQAPTPLPAAQPVIVIQAPAPPDIGSRINGWIAAGTLIIIGVGALASLALKKAAELKPLLDALRPKVQAIESRQDRQAMKQGSIQEQVTTLALQTTPVAAPEAPPAVPCPETPESKRTGLRGPAATLLTMFLVAAGAACTTNGPDEAKNAQNAGINAAGSQALAEAGKILGKAAVGALLSVAQSEAQGGKADFMSAAATGLWSQANSGTTSSAMASIASAFSAGKARQTAAALKVAAAPALASGQDPTKVAGAIATVLSTAAGAPPR